MNSPFLNDILEAIKNVRSANASNCISNKLHCNELASYLLRKLGPFSPLWASFLHKRENNAIVESHFKVMKHDLLSSINMKPSRAIKDMRADTLARMMKIHTSKIYKEKKSKNPFIKV